MAQRARRSLLAEKIDTFNILKTENAEPIISLVINNSSNGERSIFYKLQDAANT